MKNLNYTDNLQTSLLIILLVTLSFPLSLISKFRIDQIQIIGLLVLMVILYHRFLFPRVAKKNQRLAIYIEITPFLLLIPLLVLSTGGFLSPLLIIVHLSAISLALVLNPLAALAYLLTTLTILVMHFLTVSHLTIADNLSLIIISFLSFLATIPLFYLFSQHEKTQIGWLSYLDKQVITSQAQEEALMANLNEAIIVVSPEKYILNMNKKAEELTGFSEVEAVGRTYTDILKLSDNTKIALGSSPINRVISANKALFLKEITVQNNHRSIKVRVKFSPIRDSKATLLGILIVVFNATSATEIEEIQNDNLSLALFKFTTLLSDTKSYNATLLEDPQLSVTQRNYVDRLSHINSDLLRLADDFLLSIRLDQENVALKTESIDLPPLLEGILGKLDTLAQKEKVTHKLKKVNSLTIRTDKTLLTKALTNLLVIATRLSQDKDIIAIDITADEERLKIYFNFETLSMDLDTHALREKFFGGGDLFVSLPKATGLEVYLADNLLQLLGGRLIVTKNPKHSKQIEFLVELPLS